MPNKYADFADVFLPKLVSKLLKHRINDNIIELKDDKQPPYGSIYFLGPVKLETLKAYMENNLANGFIKPIKSLTGAPIFFDKKPDGSLRLCIDYQGFNNLTIKNWYPLPLVKKPFKQFGWGQRFTQLHLTNTYH